VSTQAIYRGRLATITDDTGDGVILDGELFVSYGDHGLFIDPTDAQIEAVEQGNEIPLDDEETAFVEEWARLTGAFSEDQISKGMAEWKAERRAGLQGGTR
jgi:hypothetical protein